MSIKTHRWSKYLPILLEQQHHRCVYCGQIIEIVKNQPTIKHKKYKFPDNMATIDHIIPLSADGDKTDLNNLLATCHHCNSIKSNMPIDKFIQLLELNNIDFNKIIQKRLKPNQKSGISNIPKKPAFYIKLKSIRKRRLKNAAYVISA